MLVESYYYDGWNAQEMQGWKMTIKTPSDQDEEIVLLWLKEHVPGTRIREHKKLYVWNYFHVFTESDVEATMIKLNWHRPDTLDAYILGRR